MEHEGYHRVDIETQPSAQLHREMIIMVNWPTAGDAQCQLYKATVIRMRKE